MEGILTTYYNDIIHSIGIYPGLCGVPRKSAAAIYHYIPIFLWVEGVYMTYYSDIVSSIVNYPRLCGVPCNTAAAIYLNPAITMTYYKVIVTRI